MRGFLELPLLHGHEWAVGWTEKMNELTKDDLNKLDDMLEDLIVYYNHEEVPKVYDDKVQDVYDLLDKIRTLKDTLLK